VRRAARQSALHLDLHAALWKNPKAKQVHGAGPLRIWWLHIYTVNVLHGFDILGGSNGYWRTALLRTHGFVPTEGIDSSLRAVVRGQRIASFHFQINRRSGAKPQTTLQQGTARRSNNISC
jgi:hypothetical protein